jgi:hypothetical protein
MLALVDNKRWTSLAETGRSPKASGNAECPGDILADFVADIVYAIKRIVGSWAMSRPSSRRAAA